MRVTEKRQQNVAAPPLGIELCETRERRAWEEEYMENKQFTFLFTIFEWQQINEKKVRKNMQTEKKNEMCSTQIAWMLLNLCPYTI